MGSVSYADLEASKWIQSIGFSFISFGCALIVLAFAQISVAKNLFTRVIVNIGKASYVTYLAHMPVIQFFESIEWTVKGKVAEFGYWAVVVVACLLFGAFLHLFVEKPILRCRDRFSP